MRHVVPFDSCKVVKPLERLASKWRPTMFALIPWARVFQNMDEPDCSSPLFRKGDKRACTNNQGNRLIDLAVYLEDFG